MPTPTVQCLDRARLTAGCLLAAGLLLALPRTALPSPAAPTAAGPAMVPAQAGLLGTLPAQWLDDRGHGLDLRGLAGQRIVFTMAYAACHRICPMTMQHLQHLQEQLDKAGSHATFVVVGYDPENEDPAAWHQYRHERRLERANWLFLTAPNARQVREFANRLGFEFWKYDEHVMHEERVVVVDAQGNLQLSFGPGVALDAAAIIADRHSADSKGS